MSIHTKWPRLIVVGEPVDPEQADEILVRTAQWYLSTNDREFEQQVYQAIGISMKQPNPNHPNYRVPDFWELNGWERAHGVLELSYLHNNRISSAWIGGPHGWCDWNGTIGTFNYNIGKWPSDEAVLEDAQKIAAAFPYLEMVIQTIEEEGEGEISLEIAVADGKATQREPQGILVHPSDWNDQETIEDFARRIREPGRERGVDIDRLVRAVHRVEGVEIGSSS